MRLILGLAVMFFLFNCSTQKKIPNTTTSEAPQPVEVVIAPGQVKYSKMPVYKFTTGTPEEYPKAIEYLKTYGNTDEFYKQVETRRTRFAHTDLSVSMAIRVFRDCLERGDVISIEFWTPILPTRAIGSWNGKRIRDNTKIIMDSIERAGHLLHETSHKCGFVHSGNYANANDNLNSFPYAIGDDFEAFLKMKYKTHIAGEI